MKRILYCLFSLLFLSCSNTQQDVTPLQDPSASYVITFSEDKKSARVEASFSIDEPQIYMFVQETKELPDGEASFIKNLMMKDVNGKEIGLKNLGVGDWEHNANRNDRVSISYEIELKHDKYPWPGGIDEVVFVRDDGIFFTGDALFIIPGQNMKNISIAMNVPPSWKVSVPWKNSGKNTYVAETYRDLIINCGFVGTHDVENISIDQFQLQLAIGGSQKKSKQLFINTMKPALQAFTKLFGGSRFSNYLIVIHDDVQSDGGAFRSSFSQVIDGKANTNSVVTWGHTMVHEIFHLWNGNAIVPSTQEEWFKEGFTDYMSVKYLYSLKIFNETNFLKAMENTYRKYVLAQMMNRMMNQTPISVQESGNEKAKNRLLVYGGGALVAMMLDVELLERTNYTFGVNELLRRMYAEFGVTDKRYTMSDIIRITNDLSKEDMTWFFEKYVTKAEQFDVRPYYAKLGLQLDTFVEEIYLSKIPNRTKAQERMFNTAFTQQN